MTNNIGNATYKVSVVIPTRNRKCCLKRALNSVFNQTMEKSWYEVIIVDDNSSEDLSEIINCYPVRYIKNPVCLGGAESRNIGIAHARGEFIAFLDDDDEWLPEKLKTQYMIMQINGLEFTSTGFSYYNGANKLLKIYKGRNYQAKMRHKILMRNFIGTTSSVMMTKDALLRWGAFDPVFEALQDYELWTKLLLHKAKYFYIDEQLVKYYVHSENRISGRSFDVYRASVRYYLKYHAAIASTGLRRYWVAYLIRLKAELFRDQYDENRYMKSFAKSFCIYKRNSRRFLGLLYYLVRNSLFNALNYFK